VHQLEIKALKTVDVFISGNSSASRFRVYPVCGVGDFMELIRAAFDLDYSDYSRVRWVAAFSAHVSVGTPDTQHHSRNRICRFQDRRLMTGERSNIS